jgi:hypothetical protein
MQEEEARWGDSRAQAEEEGESTLFMASTAMIEPVAAHAHPSVVHLDEGKLFVQGRPII